MSLGDAAWIEKTGAEVWRIVGDGFDALEDAPAVLVLDYLLDQNDGPGPDAVIDPLISIAAKRWLIPLIVK